MTEYSGVRTDMMSMGPDRLYSESGPVAFGSTDRMDQGTVARFWAKVTIAGQDDCWPWSSYVRTDGYGKTYFAGHYVRTHRLAYELSVGPVPEGLVLDHLCRNRKCANPRHLESVTRGENVRRGVGVGAVIGGIRSSRTHCPSGHPLSGDNLTIGHRRGGGVHRGCRECHRIAVRKSRAKSVTT